MAFLEKNKAKIYYEVYGNSGDWLALINGFTRSSSDFRMMARFFEKQGFRVLLFDNRGAGKTLNKEVFSLEDIADDLEELTKELRIDSLSLAGFSMGGIIARCFAHKYTKKVKALILVSTPFDKSFVTKSGAGFFSKNLLEIEENFSRYVAESFFKKNRVLLKSMAQRTFNDLEKGYRKSHESQRLAIEMTQDSLFSIPDKLKYVLLIHGQSDQITPLSHAQQLKGKYPKAELKILAEAGHLLLIEKTKELYEMVFSFISGFD